MGIGMSVGIPGLRIGTGPRGAYISGGMGDPAAALQQAMSKCGRLRGRRNILSHSTGRVCSELHPEDGLAVTLCEVSA
jgi:hypothetical protein